MIRVLKTHKYRENTGRVRLRQTRLGLLVLQVEERFPAAYGGPGSFDREWRDARLEDIDVAELVLGDQPEAS